MISGKQIAASTTAAPERWVREPNRFRRVVAGRLEGGVLLGF